MALPPATTPLYNHPLPEIERWLDEQGFERSKDDIHCWLVNRPDWKAELCLDVDQIVIRYFDFDGSSNTMQRTFKYSLSRQDIEDAIFAGP